MSNYGDWAGEVQSSMRFPDLTFGFFVLRGLRTLRDGLQGFFASAEGQLAHAATVSAVESCDPMLIK